MRFCISYIFKPASGGAWLSSTRVLICLVKSLNECNPIIYFTSMIEPRLVILLVIRFTTSLRLDAGGIRSSRYALYGLGYPYDTMAFTIGCDDLSLN